MATTLQTYPDKPLRDNHETGPHPDFVVQLDEEVLAFEAQLPDLRPAECVDFGVSLKNIIIIIIIITLTWSSIHQTDSRDTK